MLTSSIFIIPCHLHYPHNIRLFSHIYRYYFLCGRWLAADEEDGQVDRILPVAADDEVAGFQNVFFR